MQTFAYILIYLVGLILAGVAVAGFCDLLGLDDESKDK